MFERVSAIRRLARLNVVAFSEQAPDLLPAAEALEPATVFEEAS